jgi:hypothetical protein
MLIRLSHSQLQGKLSEIQSLANRMESINGARLAKIAEINKDTDHTMAWKAAALDPLRKSPELEALGAQVKLLEAVIKEQKTLWGDYAVMLRAAAVPERSQVGSDSYVQSMTELQFLLSEAAALSVNPSALQAAVDAAMLAEDWRKLYTLTVGRIDKFGRALPSESGLTGTPLEYLAIPGMDEAAEIFHKCELEFLRARAVILQHSAGDINNTGNGWKLGIDTQLHVEKKRHADFIKFLDQFRTKGSALERWELLKNGVPPEPTFAERVKAATDRVKAFHENHAALSIDDGESTIPQ